MTPMWLRRSCLFVSSGALLAISLCVLAQWNVHGVLDDAFMYVRYADHIIKNGVVQWNPGGPPTFGATSLLHLGLVTLVRWGGVADQVALLLGLSSLIGIMFIAALLVLVTDVTPAGTVPAVAVRAITLLALLPRVAAFTSHFTSGMDTVTAMLAVALFLIAIARYASSRSTGALIAAAVIAPTLMLVRPDLLVFACGIPAAWWLWPAQPGDRARASVALIYMAAVTALTLWVQQRWLGSMLPLPFWAKTGGVYGGEFNALYRLASGHSLLDFLLKTGLPLMAVAGVALAGPRRFWQSADWVTRGAVVAALVFMGFYVSAVVPIMDVNARFYYPVLPALALIAVRAGALALSRLQLGRWLVPSDVLVNLRLTATALVAGVVLMSIGQQAVAVASEWRDGALLRTDLSALFSPETACWQHPLDLPPDAVFATTEAGVLATNADRVVYDLAGINSADFLKSPLDPRRIAQLRPDALLIVHRDYGQQIRALRADPDFQRSYLEVGEPAGELNALRRDSPYFDRLLKSGPCR